jgi:hypothetical protein
MATKRKTATKKTATKLPWDVNKTIDVSDNSNQLAAPAGKKGGFYFTFTDGRQMWHQSEEDAITWWKENS